jgi:hypothetical protein
VIAQIFATLLRADWLPRTSEEQSEFRHNGSKRNCHRNPDLAVKCSEFTASGPTEAAEMLAFRKCRRSDNSEEQPANSENSLEQPYHASCMGGVPEQ